MLSPRDWEALPARQEPMSPADYVPSSLYCSVSGGAVARESSLPSRTPDNCANMRARHQDSSGFLHGPASERAESCKCVCDAALRRGTAAAGGPTYPRCNRQQRTRHNVDRRLRQCAAPKATAAFRGTGITWQAGTLRGHPSVTAAGPAPAERHPDQRFAPARMPGLVCLTVSLRNRKLPDRRRMGEPPESGGGCAGSWQ